MNRRYPRYPDDADYQTNAPSYYEDLARKQKLIELLAKKIWEYEETLDLTLEEITNRLESYIQENDNLMSDRLDQWDSNLEKFPENVELLLQEWLLDGTLDHIINETIFNWKADKTYVDDLNEKVTSRLTQIVTLNVKDFGAVGDGITDDTEAFNLLNAHIETLNEPFKLLVPSGNFRVGKQVHIEGEYPYYQLVGSGIRISGKSDFEVEFIGKITFNDNLHYGSFDKDTGEVHHAPTGGFTDSNYRARMGDALHISDSSNFKVINFHADGNMEKTIVGGYWDDKGIQVQFSGLYLSDVDNFVIDKGLSTNFGLDGLYVRTFGKGTFNDFISRKNGRQGLSITKSFNGLVFNSCIFEDTGRGKIKNLPSAGVDIEDNRNTNKNITFNDCIFRNNIGSDVLTLNPSKTDNIDFFNCEIYSMDNTTGIWSEARGVKFHDCKIGASVTRSNENVKYFNCEFKAKIDELGNVAELRNSRLIENIGVNNEFHNCSFLVEKNEVVIYTQSSSLFKECKFTFKIPNLRDSQRVAVFTNTRLDSCTFIEINDGSYTIKASGERAFIETNNVNYLSKNYFKTMSIGVGSRVGSVNVVVGSNRVGFNYKETFNVVVDGMDSETPFESEFLPYGSYLIQISKPSGNTTYRKFRATLIVNNDLGGDIGYHSGTVLNSNNVIPAEIDVKAETTGLKVVFTPKETAQKLNGETFLFTVISLENFNEML